MADLSKGQIFTEGGTVTSEKLHNLVQDMTVSSIDRNDAHTNYSFITQSASPLASPAAGELWKSTDETEALAAFRDGSWRGAVNTYLPIYNYGSTTIGLGILVMPTWSAMGLLNGAVQVEVCALPGPVAENRITADRCCGVSVQSIAPGGYGLAIVNGYAPVTVEFFACRIGGCLSPRLAGGEMGVADIGPEDNGSLSGFANNAARMYTVIGFCMEDKLADGAIDQFPLVRCYVRIV